LLVVIILLAIAFRSLNDVAFPLIGLSFALIWTYGVLNYLDIRFTALEVAVAPLVLGLGIDYAIHLQRAFSAIRKEQDDPAEAWLRACARLSIPLSLAVVTTVAAFLANVISPLPPLATFGYALAFGVLCAFVSSTVVVGALHVVRKKASMAQLSQAITMPRLVGGIVAVQQKQQVTVILVTILISGISIFGAASLETDFDLADFVDPDMEIMQVREDMASSYDSAGWKLIYILFEPNEDSSHIPGDSMMLDELRGLHKDLETNHDVVGTDNAPASPSYEGPYVVLRDAILRNQSFGESHNLEVYAGGVYVLNTSNEFDLAPAFSELSSNQTVADVLTGETWAQRIEQTVYLEDGQIKYFRTEIRVEASTSAESKLVISKIEGQLGSTSEQGTLRYNLEEHAQLYVTGDLVILQTVLDGLNTSQIKSTVISLFVSMLVLLVLTRRVVPALAVLLPVALASLWVAGSMFILGLKWNVLTVMVTALTIGIGIDYSIHMWRRIEVELARRDSHWEALRAALSTTGVALIMSALTTAFGFLVLMFSPMPVIQDFGLITAVTVFFSLLLALLLLPVLIELSARNQEEVLEKDDGVIIEG
jgi:predicted RND superfamily exporter protein